MQIEYHIDTEKGIITETWPAEVNFEDYKDLKYREFSDPMFESNYDIISDLRNANLEYSEDDLNQIFQLFRENLSKIGKRKSALITDKPMQVVSTMLFKEKIKELPLNVQVFSTIEAAMKWILEA